jgi:hypothetical protein
VAACGAVRHRPSLVDDGKDCIFLYDAVTPYAAIIRGPFHPPIEVRIRDRPEREDECGFAAVARGDIAYKFRNGCWTDSVRRLPPESRLFDFQDADTVVKFEVRSERSTELSEALQDRCHCFPPLQCNSIAWPAGALCIYERGGGLAIQPV